MKRYDIPFSILQGLVLTDVKQLDSEMLFTTEHDGIFKLCHHQDCCESVYIEDVVGDLDDLIDTEILVAEERSSRDDDPLDSADESYTWTYYTLRTIKGSVDIRFFGTSNGYYSESAQLDRIG